MRLCVHAEQMIARFLAPLLGLTSLSSTALELNKPASLPVSDRRNSSATAMLRREDRQLSRPNSVELSTEVLVFYLQ